MYKDVVYEDVMCMNMLCVWRCYVYVCVSVLTSISVQNNNLYLFKYSVLLGVQPLPAKKYA